MRKFNKYRTIQKPVKAHKCIWCPYAIAIGESHVQFIGTWQGEFQNWRVHHECLKPMEQEEGYQDSQEICSGPHGRGEKCEC